MTVRILRGDALAMLRTLPERSVQCVVTSPPYFQLRDYQTGRWEGGADDCSHEQARIKTRFDYPLTPGLGPTGVQTQASNAGSDAKQYRSECPCGAVRVDQQIGLERTPGAFLDALYAVFDEVKRVLRDDGVCFVNLGDSYNGSGKGGNGGPASVLKKDAMTRQGFDGNMTKVAGARPKSLLLIPERFAIGMADRGWIVRSQIVWAKRAPMPESIRDRPTSAWEPIWMFTKSPKYFYDAEAVRQPLAVPIHAPGNKTTAAMVAGPMDRGGKSQWDRDMSEPWGNPAGANIRNVWHLGPEPSRDEHYASYPTEIPRRCILAATSEKGQCPACGSPWARVVERVGGPPPGSHRLREDMRQTEYNAGAHPDGVLTGGALSAVYSKYGYPSRNTTGWQPTCRCDAGAPVPQTVLDPFLGSGTTALVADRLGRDAVGIELSEKYAEMARRRLEGDAPMFADVEVAG